MPKLTYVGPHPRGVVLIPSTKTGEDGPLPDERVPFTRGEPVEFTTDQARHLPSEEWKAPTTKAAKAAPTPEED
jgi:hypothetical protein